jgi:hypothetical protein
METGAVVKDSSLLGLFVGRFESVYMMCWLAQKSVLYLEQFVVLGDKASTVDVMRLVLASTRNLAIDDELGVLLGKEIGDPLMKSDRNSLSFAVWIYCIKL